MRGICNQYNGFAPEATWLIQFQLGNGISEEIMQTACIAFELDITDMCHVLLCGLVACNPLMQNSEGLANQVGKGCVESRAGPMWWQCRSKL